MAAAEIFGIGDELRKARRLAGIKQADLAKIVGVSRATVSNWENGIGEPTISQWRRIAEAVDAPWLLGTGVTKPANLALLPDLPESPRQMALRLFAEPVREDRRTRPQISRTLSVCA